MSWPFSRPRIEHLDRYLARKEYDKALRAVADALKKNPSQFNLLLRQAEILGLAGDREEAIRVYRRLAERYARDGFYAKAIALYKKILKLDPDRQEIAEELARVIEEDREAKRPLAERLREASARVETRPAGETDPALLERLKELKASALFAAFTGEALQEVLTSTALRSFQEGDIIVTEGEPGSSLFLIVSGHVKVYTRDERGGHIPLAELGPGDFFGEISLLTGRPRTATITAREPVVAIELDRESVDRIARTHPEVLTTLEEFYRRRAEETVEAVIRRLRDGE